MLRSFLVLSLLLIWNLASAKEYCLNGVSLELEEMTTSDQHEKGMMFRDGLAPRHGMIFIYERPQELVFWMKNTKVALDIIFLDKNGIITKIHKNAQPFSTTSIRSEGPALTVIEINAGESDTLGLKVGDSLGDCNTNNDIQN